MKYECKPGIVYCKICGEAMLIPTRSATENNHNIIRLTLPASIVWKAISNGKSLDIVNKLFGVLFHKTIEEAAEVTLQVIDDFKRSNLIIEIDE